jgi:hypothetical protein
MKAAKLSQETGDCVLRVQIGPDRDDQS